MTGAPISPNDPEDSDGETLPDEQTVIEDRGRHLGELDDGEFLSAEAVAENLGINLKSSEAYLYVL